MTKYKAKRTEVDGILFDSKGEADRYQELKLLERSGQINGLSLQPEFKIEINGKHICKVKLDFAYWENDERIYEDFKGMDTPISKLKRKLVEAKYGIKVLLTRARK